MAQRTGTMKKRNRKNGLPPVRFSNLHWMARSAAHYKYYLDNPIEQTKAMRYGDALDALTFGHKKVLVFDGASRRGNKWENWADANRADDTVLLLPNESLEVGLMYASLKSNLEAMRVLKGDPQQTLNWKIGQRKCKGTPDVFWDDCDTPYVTELKATRNANPSWFEREARQRGYHAQLAWYANGIERSGYGHCPVGHIVAVENTPPYPVVVFTLTERALLEGEKLWRLWFERLLVCEQSNRWPAYSETPVPMDTPDMDSLTLKIDGEEMEVE